MKTRRSVRAVRLLGAAALLSAWASALAQPPGGGGPPPASVRFDAARTETVQQMRTATGELRPARVSRVAAEEEGLIVELLADVGDAVERGDVLARLDTELVEIERARLGAIRDAEAAAVREAAAAVRRRERDVERLRGAVRSGGVSSTELEDARTELEAASAALARAEADLASAQSDVRRVETRLAKMIVRAPFAGEITAKLAETGEWADRGDALFELVQLDPIDAWLEVPEDYLTPAARSAGTIAVEVTAAGFAGESADVELIASGDSLARTFPVRVRLENPSGALKPGMSATAMIPTGRREQMLTIAKDAVLRNDAGPYVYFDDGGVAAPAQVNLLWSFGERAVITPGRIRVGSRLVIEGNERLFPGQPLTELGGAPSGGPSDGELSESGGETTTAGTSSTGSGR